MTRFAELFDFLVEYQYVKTQQDLADMVYISRPVISQLISGKRELTDKHIRHICRQYSFVDPEWLKTGQGQMILPCFNVGPKGVFPLSPEDEQELENYLNSIYQSEADEEYTELKRRASLYDAKVKEAQLLYTKLSEKEAEISRLLLLCDDQSKKIRQLKMQIAGLRKEEGENQPDILSSGAVEKM